MHVFHGHLLVPPSLLLFSLSVPSYLLTCLPLFLPLSPETRDSGAPHR